MTASCTQTCIPKEDCPNPSAHPKASSQALGCDIPDDLSHTWAQRKFPLLVPTLFSECFCSYQPHDPSFMSFPIPSHYKVMAFSMVPQMPKDLFHFLNQNIILTTKVKEETTCFQILLKLWYLSTYKLKTSSIWTALHWQEHLSTLLLANTTLPLQNLGPCSVHNSCPLAFALLNT